MEEKEKQKDVGTKKKGRTGNSRVERNSLMCSVIWDYAATRGHLRVRGIEAARVC